MEMVLFGFNSIECFVLQAFQIQDFRKMIILAAMVLRVLEDIHV